MTSTLIEAQQDFELFHNDYIQYQQKVDQISQHFNLKGDSKLKSDFLPTYFTGDFEDGKYKYILWSLNPGFSEKNNHREENRKKSSWEDYIFFTKNFFHLFKKYKMKSRYYQMLSKLFSGLDQIQIEEYDQIYDYYQEHVINVDLIPYHSKSFGIASNLGLRQRQYLLDRFKSNLNFLKNLNTKLMIFNGNTFYQLLIKNELIEYDEVVKVNDKVRMYSFHMEGIPCLLFDKFLSQPAFGLRNEDFIVNIPNLIKENFPKI